MCHRSTEVIPSLVRRINRLEAKTSTVAEMVTMEKEYVVSLTNENKQLRINCVIRIFISLIYI